MHDHVTDLFNSKRSVDPAGIVGQRATEGGMGFCHFSNLDLLGGNLLQKLIALLSAIILRIR